MFDISGNVNYDAARANWGGTWRLPTKTEMQELIDKCTWTWTTQNGVKGYKVTGPNGNSIFLPDANSSHGYYGCYWSSTPDEDYGVDYAYGLNFKDGSPDMNLLYARYYGHSVRPVLE